MGVGRRIITEVRSRQGGLRQRLSRVPGSAHLEGRGQSCVGGIKAPVLLEHAHPVPISSCDFPAVQCEPTRPPSTVSPGTLSLSSLTLAFTQTSHPPDHPNLSPRPLSPSSSAYIPDLLPVVTATLTAWQILLPPSWKRAPRGGASRHEAGPRGGASRPAKRCVPAPLMVEAPARGRPGMPGSAAE
jgi:hypothetical protein